MPPTKATDQAHMAPAPPEIDVSGLSYEQARAQLVEVVDELEQGGQPLEDALTLWERGQALAGRCQEWLDAARQRIDAVHGAATTPAAQTETAEAPTPAGT